MLNLQKGFQKKTDQDFDLLKHFHRQKATDAKRGGGILKVFSGECALHPGLVEQVN